MLYNLLFLYKFLKDRNVSIVSLLPKPGPMTSTQRMVMKHFVDSVNAFSLDVQRQCLQIIMSYSELSS